MALLESNCPNLRLVARGKVRDIYEFPGDESKLLFVATDRISAFDIVMKNGKLLTQLSLFFFKKLESVIPNHVISGDFDEILSLSLSSSNAILPYRDQLEGRTILVKKSQVLKCEAIVRGYLTVHGIPMPNNLVESSKFPEPIFTPSTKADIGTHDENIHPDKLGEVLGSETLANQVKKASIALYEAANDHCLSSNSGLFLADTKFEFGLDPSNNNQVLLIDECLTPDSSRFWATNQWSEDQLEIPKSVVDSTWIKYREAFKLLTGREFVP
ncbi:hypothetical protein H4Q26_012099 [Puccinia striiformis f. sp. tritici PST-130]|nr:hypothetical protein H4Q26_012099 [Puccinia striiformis f. sp. tritici PST-130]